MANVPHWHPHQLRHNHATMVRRQYGLEVARILLGHKTAAVTEIYAEADEQKAVEIAAKIG
jgi:integrase